MEPRISQAVLNLVAVVVVLCIPLSIALDFLSPDFEAERYVVGLFLTLAGLGGYNLRNGSKAREDSTDVQ